MNWELTGEITHQETFAEGSKIRELHRLIDAFGGKNWKKRKGFARIRMLTSGLVCPYFKNYNAVVTLGAWFVFLG